MAMAPRNVYACVRTRSRLHLVAASSLWTLKRTEAAADCGLSSSGTHKSAKAYDWATGADEDANYDDAGHYGHLVETASAANVEHILKTNFENYPKGEFYRTIFGDLLGSGIFNADCEVWKVQRRVASPVCSTRSLREVALGSVQKELVERFLPILESCCDRNAVVDCKTFCCGSLSILFASLHSVLTLAARTRSFPKALDDAVLLSTRRALAGTIPLWQVQKLVNVGSERRLRQSLQTVDAFALGLIKTRREELADGRRDQEQTSDLLSKFIQIADALVESSLVIKVRIEQDFRCQIVRTSDLFLRDIVISFILAGRDTSACALTWFFWLLLSNPKAETKIWSEIEATLAMRRDQEDSMFSFEELKGMHYLHAALTEAMRLYPPIPHDTKEAVAADVWPDGTAIAKGIITSFNFYATGRNSSILGGDCLQFRLSIDS